MKQIKILIDNGHGSNTQGKQSPDGVLREYKYTREIAEEVVKQLRARGYDAERIVTEDYDVSISERCRRVNTHCNALGSKNVLLVSIHNNGLMNEWASARGWLCMIDDAASDKAKSLACLLHDEATTYGLQVRHYKPGQKWYLYSQALGKAGVRLGILRGTKCPAVLTENLFMTNKEDVAYLNSEEGKQAITDLHVQAIIKYCNEH